MEWTRPDFAAVQDQRPTKRRWSKSSTEPPLLSLHVLWCGVVWCTNGGRDEVNAAIQAAARLQRNVVVQGDYELKLQRQVRRSNIHNMCLYEPCRTMCACGKMSSLRSWPRSVHA